METLKAFFTLSILVLATFIIGCSQSTISQTGTASDINMGHNSVNPLNLQHLSLADYLRRVPGVSIGRGDGTTHVRVRGISSINENNSPLFVIDKMMVGNDYLQAEQMVDTNDIRSVLVLKDPSEIAQYGMRGSAGVIIIKTKK